MTMKKLIDTLNKIECPKEVKEIIILSISEVKSHFDKPISTEVQNILHKKIMELI
jgi:hypothetical protein